METRARGERRRLVGKILREMRLTSGLRQVDVALRLGVPQSVVSKIEAGERTADAVEVWRWCRALGLPMTRFVGELEQAVTAAR